MHDGTINPDGPRLSYPRCRRPWAPPPNPRLPLADGTWMLLPQTPKLLLPSLVPMTLKLQTIFSYLSDGYWAPQ